MVNAGVPGQSAPEAAIASLPHDRSRPFLAGVFWVLVAVSVAVFAGIGVRLDDAYVYFRVAEHLAETGRPFFNEGDAFTITTSPAWLLMTTALAKVAPAMLPTLSKALFISFLVAASVTARAILRLKLPVLGALAAIPVFFAPNMLSLVGMETSFALFVGLALILSFQRRDRWTPLWAVLFYLARPEGLILAGILGAALVILAIREHSLLERLRFYGAALALGGILAGAWHVWLLQVCGSLLPVSADAKILQGAAGWTTFVQAWPMHVAVIWGQGDQLWLNLLRLAIALVGGLAIARVSWPLMAWPVGHFVLYAALGVAYYHWYYYVIDFVLTLSAVAGVAVLLGQVARLLGLGDKRAGVVAVALSAALLTIVALPTSRVQLVGLLEGRAESENARFSSYTRLAEAMRRATGDKPFTLLTHEIGILGWLLPQATVRDVVGLATPVETPADLWNWAEQVRVFAPEFILTPFSTHGQPQVYTRSDGSLVRYDVFLADAKWTVLRAQDPSSQAAADFREEERRARALIASAVSVGAPAEIFPLEGALAILAHAPARFELTPPVGASGLELEFGYRTGSGLQGHETDGARFSVIDVATRRTLYGRQLDPTVEPADRQGQRAVVPLRGGRIEIRIDPLATAKWDLTYLKPVRWMYPARVKWTAGCSSGGTVLLGTIPSDADVADEQPRPPGSPRAQRPGCWSGPQGSVPDHALSPASPVRPRSRRAGPAAGRGPTRGGRDLHGWRPGRP